MLKKLWQIPLLILLIWLGFESVNYFIYKNIEVTSYQDLMKKSAYGQVTREELKIGAVDLIESVQCNLSSEKLINHCRETFAVNKEKCLAQVFDQVDIQGLSAEGVNELLRHFNSCRRQPVQ